MAKIKAIDFLEKDKDYKRGYQILLLVGDDQLLKEVVAEDFGCASDMWPDNVDTHEIEDARNLLGEWQEGSLMGPRFLRVYTPGKMKRPEILLEIKASESEDKLVIITGENWSGVSQTKAAEGWLEVDCKELKSAKEKQKYLVTRAKSLGLSLTEEGVKVLAERSTKTVDLESSLKTLKLLEAADGRIRYSDVVEVAGEPPRFRDTTRAILHGNIPRLTKEILENDPLPTLVGCINVLLKLYSWLIDPEENHENVADRLKIPKRFIKDWRDTKKRYSPRLIREVIEGLNEIYQEIRRGDDHSWREKVRMVVNKLNP